LALHTYKTDHTVVPSGGDLRSNHSKLVCNLVTLKQERLSTVCATACTTSQVLACLNKIMHYDKTSAVLLPLYVVQICFKRVTHS
jgi:hypothetical protein